MMTEHNKQPTDAPRQRKRPPAVGKARGKQLIMMAERSGDALELRRTGLSYRAIGARLGISHEEARRSIARGMELLAEANREQADALRQESIAQIEFAMEALRESVAAGSPKAIDQWRKLIETRAKLAGILTPYHPTEIHDQRTFVLNWGNAPLPSPALHDGNTVESPVVIVGREDSHP